MRFGVWDGLEEGDEFSGQAELFRLGFHGVRQQGISGRASEGVDSVVLAGGYADDEDHGDVITYTGMTPGTWDRERRTTNADQRMIGPNLALVKNQEDGLPVRVWRSYKHNSPWSPQQGIRFAGLYYVTNHWHSINEAGHLVYRFRLERQPSPAQRRLLIREEIHRYAVHVRTLREIYDSTCQVCGERLELPSGGYAEICHIRPLGRPHDGPDEQSNMLCLCPNHHVMLDHGAFGIADDHTLIGADGRLHVAQEHHVAREHLVYHRTSILNPMLRPATD